MKNIEETAKYYALGLKLNDVRKKEMESYAADDFTAGVEFAQKWISIEEELPPIGRCLLKSQTGCTIIRTIQQFHTRHGKLDITIDGKKIVSWRSIELK